MARKRSKRKRHGREKYMLSEQVKIETGVSNIKTMIFLSKFFNKGVVASLGSPIAKGKEADLYLAESGQHAKKFGKYVVLKFFRIETSSFFNMSDYILGDPRFSKISSKKYGIIMTWCKKEYGNLEIAQKARIDAPRPIMFNGSILAMTFIGDSESGLPAPMLKDHRLEDPEGTLTTIIKNMGKLYANNLVHGDMSEYNILMFQGKPFFIDFGQAVMLRHPKADEFLRRDVENILQYFRKAYSIDRNSAETFREITSQYQKKRPS
jgi:RIO kinase 1